MHPMDIAKLVLIGSVFLFAASYVFKFYGIGKESYWIYLVFYLFLLVSTAILDLYEPSFDITD